MRPISFTRFCRVIGLQLRPGQLVFAKVAYDGLEPHQLEGSERDLARRIFGNVDTIPPTARAVVVQAKGRDVGGTLMAAYRLVHLAATASLDSLSRTELAYCLVGGPKLRHANTALRFALTAARFLAERGEITIESETTEGFTIRRRDGRRVRFEPFAASRGGDGARGIPILAALMDEGAFYLDENSGVANDRAIFNAIVPRLLPGGQVMIVSSPWGKTGLLAEEFDANFGNATTALAAHCPTLVMRDEPEIVEMVARETARSPENARRELGAEFITGATAAFPDADSAFVKRGCLYHWGEPVAVADPGESLDDFVLMIARWGTPDQTLQQVIENGCPKTRTVVDSLGNSYIAPVYYPRDTKRLLWISALANWKGEQVRALGMEKIAEGIADFTKQHGAKLVISDQRGAPYLAALTARYGVRFRSITLGAANKHESVTLLRSFFRDGQIAITTESEHSEQFQRQLRNYKRITKSGGGFAYSGGSKAAVDDFPAALVTYGASLLLEEQGTPADETRVAIEGAPTNKPATKRHEVPINGILE